METPALVFGFLIPRQFKMKPHRLFAASAVLNIGLAAAVAYLVIREDSPRRIEAWPGEIEHEPAGFREIVPPPMRTAASAANAQPVSDPAAQPPSSSPALAAPVAAIAAAKQSAANPASSIGREDDGFRSASRASAPAPQIVDPTQPGNSFTYRGVTVAAEEIARSPTPGGAEELTVSLDAADYATAGTGQDQAAPGGMGGETSSPRPRERKVSADSTSDSASTGQPASVPALDAGWSGPFTPEEELFRTKWGWRAFDAARTAARL